MIDLRHFEAKDVETIKKCYKHYPIGFTGSNLSNIRPLFEIWHRYKLANWGKMSIACQACRSKIAGAFKEAIENYAEE
jgi:hypothetical protein